MSRYAPEGHPSVNVGQEGRPKVGVLAVNLGTPDDLSTGAVRRYLREFLWDRRIVEVPRIIWFFVLHCIILVFRPKKTAKAYQKVWMSNEDGSPLRYYTRRQGELLEKNLSDRYGEAVQTVWGMRYGNPSIASQIDALQRRGCQRLVVLPLYPQYSATTTASVGDAVFQKLQSMRWQPVVRMCDAYHDHPLYIDALKQSVEQHIATLNWQPDVIVASFHGIPKDYFEKGDAYSCFCYKTGRLLRESLGMSEDAFKITFQSRFGPREWLQPYTDDTLESLVAGGVKKVLVITPGFAADCIETLEEIAMESKSVFESAGGTHFSVVPCLNDNPAHIELMAELVRGAAGDWFKR